MTPSRRAVLAAGLAALAGTAGPARARPLDEVVERGRLRVGVYRDFPPFSSGSGDGLVGIDVDLGRLFADRLGVRVEYLEHTAGETVADDLRVAVWRGHVLGTEPADVMMHMPYDKEFGLRNPEAVLFAPYQRERFALARSPLRLPNAMIDALPDGERIGVELDTVPDFFLLGAFGGRFRSSITHFHTVTEAATALVAGEVAAVLAPLSQLEGALGPRAADFPVTVTTLPGMPSAWDIGVAVKENARDLGYAITDIVAALEDDGTLDAVFRRHGVTRKPPAANEAEEK